MKLAMRWFGAEHDTIPLAHIRQVPGVVGVVTTLYGSLPGQVWERDAIRHMKAQVKVHGLEVCGIESVNVHDAIKAGLPERDMYIDRYIQTLEHLGEGVLEGRADAVADAVDGDAVDAVAGDTGAAEQAGDAGSPWSGVSPWEAENAGDGQDVVLARARTICDAAAAVGVTVTFEATDHADVDRMLTVVRELRPAIPSVGVTVQAHLRRSEADCRELAAARARVRLAPGTGVAPPALVYGSRLDVDRSYVRCLRSLMAGGGYPMVATHDPRLIDLAGALAAQWSRAGDSYEYQLPHGVQSGIRARLLDAGERVRVRVPYGTAWYGYLLRRTAERPASAASILRRRGR